MLRPSSLGGSGDGLSHQAAVADYRCGVRGLVVTQRLGRGYRLPVAMESFVEPPTERVEVHLAAVKLDEAGDS